MGRKRRKGGKAKAPQRAAAASEVRSSRTEARARDRAERAEEVDDRVEAVDDSTTAETERPAARRMTPRESGRALLRAFAWVGVVILLGLGGIVLLSVLPQLE